MTNDEQQPAERGEARPPHERLQVLIGRIEAWEGIEDDCTGHTELLLDIKQCLESVVGALAAAPAAQPETERRHIYSATEKCWCEEGPEPLAAPAAGEAPPQGESEQFADWTPEFTVHIVRRGKRFPMIVDSIFTNEALAKKRAALLGTGEGWHTERYSHLQPLTSPGRRAPAQEPDK